MPYIGQLGGPVLKAFGQVQNPPFGPGEKSPMITDQHTAGGSVSQLDESTARRHLNPPRSLSGRPDFGHQMVMVMNNLLQPPLFNVNRPSHSEIQLPIVKAVCVIKGQGHIWPWKFKGQGHGQTHWSHLRPGIQSICLLFVPWQSDHFWLRYSKFHIWPWKFKVKVIQGQGYGQGQTWLSHLRPEVQSIYLLSVSWKSDHFWLRYSKFHIWPWKFKVMAQGQTRWWHLRPRIQSICLLFVSWQSDQFWLRYSKFYIWPWKLKVKLTTKIDQNLIR